MNNSIDQQFVEFVVKSLVGNPDAVQVDRRVDEKGVLLELTVDPEDLGRVIGKRGATAQSLRTLLRALGTKNDARYNLKIVDNGVPHDDAAPAITTTTTAAAVTTVNEGNDDGTLPIADEDTVMADVPSVSPLDEPEQVATADSEPANDRLSRTRRELEELDDLDV